MKKKIKRRKFNNNHLNLYSQDIKDKLVVVAIDIEELNQNLLILHFWSSSEPQNLLPSNCEINENIFLNQYLYIKLSY
jgi:hypothetical protein